MIDPSRRNTIGPPVDRRRHQGDPFMAEAVILEFEGMGQREYDAVNRELGIDMSTGEGDWPEGLLMHSGGMADEGALVVTCVNRPVKAQALTSEGAGPQALVKVERPQRSGRVAGGNRTPRLPQIPA
jgi:hypothetical protein